MIKPNAIIFDIDDVLLIPSDAPYKEHTVKANEPLVKLLNSLHRTSMLSPKVILLTGRHERLRKITEEECIANNIFYERLVMNSTDNPIEPGHVSKVHDIQPLLAEFNILAIIDDDEKCCEVFRDMGLPILRVLK